MPNPKPEKKTDLHSEEFLHSLMRKQLKLSMTCALSFLLVDVRMKTRVLHTPEKLGLKQEYVEEHQAPQLI